MQCALECPVSPALKWLRRTDVCLILFLHNMFSLWKTLYLKCWLFSFWKSKWQLTLSTNVEKPGPIGRPKPVKMPKSILFVIFFLFFYRQIKQLPNTLYNQIKWLCNLYIFPVPRKFTSTRLFLCSEGTQDQFSIFRFFGHSGCHLLYILKATGLN